jgi:phosphoribosyl 1,2-cyclic phosphodiesterase
MAPARGTLQLRFLGTRGEIAARTRKHHLHSALEVAHRGRRVMIDCGADWRERLTRLGPDAIVLTHAHPDHARGLADGAPCPVYATAPTWELIGRYPLTDRYMVEPRRRLTICGVTFEAFPVEHSIRAPAVGYRVGAGESVFFYVPDLVSIDDHDAALSGLDLYVGDGASLTRPIVRRRGRRRIGHASVRAQLEWCRRAGVPSAIITHCGSQIVGGDPRRTSRWIRAAAAELGLSVTLAHDGMVVELLGARAGGSGKSRSDLRAPAQSTSLPAGTPPG